MHRWATDLFPLGRSLTGNGVRDTLRYVHSLLPSLETYEVPSGTEAMDWTVPDEWNLNEAWIEDLNGNRLVDTAVSNLHVVGYSEPVDKIVSRGELEPHLHSLPDMPDAIPYVTSYYQRSWGFCVSENQRRSLGAGPFRVRVDSSLEPGHLTYGEVLIPGESSDEVLLSTYVCHPSMANNELSGPVVAVALGRWLQTLEHRKLSYRILFVPETIGSLVVLSRLLDHFRKHLVAGWVLTCMGDDRAYSYMPSRTGDTLADRVSLAALRELKIDAERYSFLQRGSDERQYCSPRVDLPVCSLMRSKYLTYPEYHTSLDNLSLITSEGLQGSFDLMKRVVEILEANDIWRATTYGEPQLGKRGLYPQVSTPTSGLEVRDMMNVLTYCDGDLDSLQIAQIVGLTVQEVAAYCRRLEAVGVLERP